MTPINAMAALLLVSLTTPTQAAIYKCQQGAQTIYSDVPCPSAKVVDTTNGKAPMLADRYSAQARRLRDKIKLDDVAQQEARDRHTGRDCIKKVRDNNWTQTTAAKYIGDSWWQNQASDSNERLGKDCGKYLIPQGAR